MTETKALTKTGDNSLVHGNIMDGIMQQIKTTEKEANLLLPMQILSDVPAMHSVTIEYVKIDPDPEKGDVYPKEYGENNKKWILSKQALMRLAGCAGIEWNWQYCGRTDNGNDRDYISYRMVGAVRKLDGTWLALQGEKNIDFEVEEEELKDLYTTKCKNWSKQTQVQKDAYVRDSTRKELLRKRKHKLALCETGAMLRAVRGLLALHNFYTTEDLNKPFVIARLAFKPDMNDPEIRREMIKASTSAITNIYGPGKSGAFDNKKPDIEDELPPADEECGEDVIDVPPDDEIPEDIPEPEMSNAKADFLASESDVQMNILREMAKQLGSELRDYTTHPGYKGWTREQYFDFFTEEIAKREEDIPE